MRALAWVLMLALPLAAAAEVYKWVDEKGVVHYTDKPPEDNAKPAKLPPLQTYKGGTVPDLQRFDKPVPGAAPAGKAQIQVVTPSPDETFRGGERTVPVAVLVTPALTEGQKLVYLLDGQPSPPTSDTSFAFTQVERGAHTVSVTLLDAAGQEVGRSQSVTFHMKPPIVVDNLPQAQQQRRQREGGP
jgi:hypothetical protein